MNDRDPLEEWLDERKAPRSINGMALSLKGRVMTLMEDQMLLAGRDALEAAIIAAYKRGAEWERENPNSSEYVNKAARDYADKITSPANN
jgi:hypothetical protein